MHAKNIRVAVAQGGWPNGASHSGMGVGEFGFSIKLPVPSSGLSMESPPSAPHYAGEHASPTEGSRAAPSSPAQGEFPSLLPMSGKSWEPILKNISFNISMCLEKGVGVGDKLLRLSLPF